MNIRPGHEWDKFEGLAWRRRTSCEEFLARVPFAARPPPHEAARIAVPAELPVSIQPVMSTQTGFGALLNELGREKSELAERIVTDLARRHRLDQSRPLGQPPRAVRPREAGRHLQERAHPLDLQLGILAQGPAHRARHRRDEPVHPAVGARAVARDQRRAAAADRHALRSVHRARPRCAQLRLLPGGALHPGGDAVGHHAGAAKAARTSRSRRR